MTKRHITGFAARSDRLPVAADGISGSRTSGIADERGSGSDARRATALEAAARAYEDRCARSAFLDSARLFGEPAWNILLDLFIGQSRNESLTVERACKRSGAAESTARRWLKALEHEGLVVIGPHVEGDLQGSIGLSANRFQNMLHYFEAVAR